MKLSVINFPITYLNDFYQSNNLFKSVLGGKILLFGIFYAMGKEDQSLNHFKDTIKSFNVDLSHLEIWSNALERYKNVNDFYEEAQRLYSYWNKNKTPLSHISIKELLYLYYTDDESITEVELISCLANLALRSIARNNRLEVRTTKLLLFSRMAGKIKPSKQMPSHFKKWDTRRKFESLKKEIGAKYNVRFKTGKVRGIVFSISEYESEKPP